MKNPIPLLLLAALAIAQAAHAQDTFRVTIAKGNSEPKLTAAQVAQFKKAGIASPNDLPIVICPLKDRDYVKTDPAGIFQVVVTNTRGTGIIITMAMSEWHDCLTFKLADDNGNSYSIEKMAMNWASNVDVMRKWKPNGKQIFPVSFPEDNEWTGTTAWYSRKGSDEGAKVEWPALKHPVIGHLTATFRYYVDGKSVEVSSKATDVVLMAK